MVPGRIYWYKKYEERDHVLVYIFKCRIGSRTLGKCIAFVIEMLDSVRMPQGYTARWVSTEYRQFSAYAKKLYGGR